MSDIQTVQADAAPVIITDDDFHDWPEADAATEETVESAAPVTSDAISRATVSRAAFAAAIAVVVRGAEKRACIPILETVLLRATDTGLTARCTDLDAVIETVIPGATDSDFIAAVPVHTLSDLLKKAKDCETVRLESVRTIKTFDDGTVQCDTAKLRLNFDELQVTLQALNPDDFPTMECEPFSHSFVLPSAELAKALNRTEFAISTEETRYYLNGVYMHVGHKSELRIIATDGHRLSLAELPAPDGSADMPGVIIPSKTVGEVLRLCGKKGSPAETTIRLNANRIQFEIGAAIVLCKVIDGTFPDYMRCVPLNNDKECVVSASTLAKAITQVSVISSERGRAVKLTLERDSLCVTVTNPDSGAASMTVPCWFSAEPMDIGFNAGYMLEILEQIKSDDAVLMLADPGSPTLVRGRDDVDSGHTMVLMPLRV